MAKTQGKELVSKLLWAKIAVLAVAAGIK